MTLIIKFHESYRNVIALADSELIDKKFEDDKRQLDLTTTFYKGKEISEEEVIQTLQIQANEDSTFNIVGPRSVEAAKKAGLITDKNISTIDNIPFALSL
tara:strand:- start:601 stop:900 length:300 start_codon:yes stop_codon:yes gene_type:complete